MTTFSSAPTPAKNRTATSFSDGLYLPTDYIVGAEQHRSGWSYAIDGLRPYLTPYGQGLLLDDFVERTFLYGGYGPPIPDRPWIGIFHHPPHMMAWGLDKQSPQYMLRLPQWKSAAKHLVRAIALSDYLARWLRRVLPCPVDVVKHPTETPDLVWSLDRWQRNKDKRIIQIGWFLRNMSLAWQVPPIPNVTRTAVILSPSERWRNDCEAYWHVRGDRKRYAGVRTVARMPNEAYDQLLSENVIVAEFFDASANNLVVECIVRQTPILCNRHPAVVEYLGADYPLYFADPTQISDLLTDARLEQAHEYLKRLDLSWASNAAFAAGVLNSVAAAKRDSRYVA